MRKLSASSIGIPATCLFLLGFAIGHAEEHPDSAGTGAPSHTFNVRDFGARGDGTTLDTEAFNRAVAACGEAGGGQVLVPPGHYLTGTVFLRSHLTVFLAPGAYWLGTSNLALYSHPQIPASMPEARWGNWHRALIVGQDLEDVAIIGPGEIDGRKVFDPAGEERMRGPHTLLFVNCRGFTVRDLTVRDAANYAIFFEASDDVDIRDVKIVGGWDGVHFRGAPDRWCHHVSIVRCLFFTGDDSIAGRYWDDVLVSQCTLNSSCNGLRLIGPATRLIVDHCLFYGPGLEPHRSSGRTNMLSGIILQPGAWDQTRGLLDDVLLTDNTMRNVASPVTIWTKAGNPVNRITIAGLVATGVYRSALSVESWSETPITNVVLRSASIEFAGGGQAQGRGESVRAPGVDARALPAWGLYARNVEQLTLEDVRFSLAQDDLRPVIQAAGVQRLTLDAFKFPRIGAVAEPIITTNVANILVREPQPR